MKTKDADVDVDKTKDADKITCLEKNLWNSVVIEMFIRNSMAPLCNNPDQWESISS